MAVSGYSRGRGVRARGGIGLRGGFRGGSTRSDNNMFVLLENQNGDSDSVCSALSDSDGEDSFRTVKSRKSKRQRLSSGGRSDQADQVGNFDFDSLSTDEKLSALFSKLSQVENKVDRVTPLAQRVTNAESVITSHQHRLKLLEYKSIDIESRSRRRNLIFRGINEQSEVAESCISLIRDFLRVHVRVERDMYIERAHRLGKFKVGVSRPIVVAFRDYQDTELIMSNCRKLKGTLFSVNRDYPVEIVEARKALYPMYKEFRDQNRYNKVAIQFPAKLVVNGEIKYDMFPDWAEIMYGYRVDSRQLFVNNNVNSNVDQPRVTSTQPQYQPMESHSAPKDVPRDSQLSAQVLDNSTSSQQSSGEARAKCVSKPRNVTAVNEMGLRSNTNTTTSSSTSNNMSGSGASENSQDAHTAGVNDHIMTDDADRDPSGDPGGSQQQPA